MIYELRMHGNGNLFSYILYLCKHLLAVDLD